jgi:ATP-dependent DNA helicase RecQ
MDDRLEELLSRCLLLDLETGPDGAIHKIGAVWREETFLRQGRLDTQTALVELEGFAAGADFVLGHNLLGHDLPCLQAQAPGMDLLRLPVVDTLYLSPLAFPENPYHRLVKDYKLVCDSLSEPVADARLAGRVFREQWLELGRRAEAGTRELLRPYRFCFQDAAEPLRVPPYGPSREGSGLAAIFAGLGADLPRG